MVINSDAAKPRTKPHGGNQMNAPCKKGKPIKHLISYSHIRAHTTHPPKNMERPQHNARGRAPPPTANPEQYQHTPPATRPRHRTPHSRGGLGSPLNIFIINISITPISTTNISIAPPIYSSLPLNSKSIK